MRNLSELLEFGDERDERERLRFYRALAPNAIVFVAQEGFVCGLCGKAHKDRWAAQGCLGACIKSRQNDGVITAANLGDSFTCPTCNRNYARREDALDCHGRGRRLSKVFLAKVPRRGVRSWDDAGFAGLKEEDVPAIGMLFGKALRLEAMVSFDTTHDFAEARTPNCRAPAPRPDSPGLAKTFHPSVQETRPLPADADVSLLSVPLQVVQLRQPSSGNLLSSAHNPLTVDVSDSVSASTGLNSAPDPTPVPGQVQAAQSWEEAGPARDGGGPYRTPGMKAFSRQDARYKCTVCGELFFTRSEVEGCFEGHPEQP